jgi:hypothetical protein
MVSRREDKSDGVGDRDGDGDGNGERNEIQYAVEQEGKLRSTHARRGTTGVTDSSRLKATLRDMVFQSPPSSFWKHFSIPRSISATTLFFTACVLMFLLLLSEDEGDI